MIESFPPPTRALEGRLRRESSFVLAALMLLLASCSGNPAKENYYTLSGPQTPTGATTNAVSVFVGPVVVPDSVDRLPMVLRSSPNQVEISDAHRWAEPLKSAIPRVLAECLMGELGTTRVMWTRLGASQAVDYRVAVEVQRFDSSLEQGATIDALWTVTPAKGGVKFGRSTLTEPATSRDPPGIAAAHSRALEKVAKEIAVAMKP